FPVLVLDEPAEHLDLATADALTADLLAATEGRTTLLITHRLAGLEAVDEVIVLDRGRVVQQGTYAELAALPGPLRRMIERGRETLLLVEAWWRLPRGPDPAGSSQPLPQQPFDHHGDSVLVVCEGHSRGRGDRFGVGVAHGVGLAGPGEHLDVV